MSTMLSRVTISEINTTPRIIIHGHGGVGKTSFGVASKKPIFLCCEEGLSGLPGVSVLPRPECYADVVACVNDLVNEKHDRSTLVIDTVDALEPLIFRETCERGSEEGKRKTFKQIEDFGFQKGYQYADDVWRELFCMLDALRAARQMSIVVLSHCHIERVPDPQIGSYDRITPKLQKRGNALLYAWADVVGYLAIDAVVTSIDGKDDKKPMRAAQSTGQRILYLEDRGGVTAKNRYDMPVQIEVPKDAPFSIFRKELIAGMKRHTKKQPEAAPAAEPLAAGA